MPILKTGSRSIVCNTNLDLADAPTANKKTVHTRDIDSLRNGSFVTEDHDRKNNKFCKYINGDFMGHIDKKPVDHVLSMPMREAKKHLPKNL